MHYPRIRVLGAIETDISAAQWATCRLGEEITFTLRIARRPREIPHPRAPGAHRRRGSGGKDPKS